jgi:mono/diheme cytochrome c family protein
VWHYQTTPGETWDYTATQPMMLAELEIGGRERKVLMQAPKNGFFYVLDRATGELISARQYTKVTWAAGIDLATGRPIQDPKMREFKNGVTVLPFIGGGHNWSPMSFDPKTGLVYLAEMSVPQTLKSPTRDIDRLPGMGHFNGGFDSLAAAPPPLPNLDEYIASVSSGRLLGWDPVRQEARWVYEQGRPSNNGTLSTAGMLVFQGDPFGNVRAFDAENGKPLWSFDVQTAAMAGPVSYSVDGQQYIAFAVGVGGGLSHEAGALSHAWKQRNHSRVLAFRLGGTAELPPAPPDERVMPKPQSVTASAEVVAHGQVMYQRFCSYCHGDALRTGALNPDLRWSSADVHAVWQDIVIGGMLQPVGMVSFKEFLTPADAEAIRQYVLTEANREYARTKAAAPGGAN